MIYAVVPSSFGLGSEDAHLETFWILLYWLGGFVLKLATNQKEGSQQLQVMGMTLQHI